MMGVLPSFVEQADQHSDALSNALRLTMPVELSASENIRQNHDPICATSPPTSALAIRAEEYLGGSLNECDQRHAEVVLSILARFARLDIAIDATGALRRRESWELAAVDLAALGRAITFDLRKIGPANSARVIETAEEIISRDAGKRRGEILDRFLRKSANPAGVVEVRRWVRAVTGENREADVVAVLHWIWLVKKKQSGQHGELQMMLVIYGPQESGKSRAAMALIKPWEELADIKMEASSLTDERCRPALALRAIGLLDELAGMSRADAAELKSTITAIEVGYRPMRSNDRRVMPMMMTFIGTSNKSVSELVHDSSGARRFYELKTPERCDWKTINGIDYELLWKAVSEDDPAPGVVNRQLIASEQRRLVWRDPIECWLEVESFTNLRLRDGTAFGCANPRNGIPTSELYARFRHWCQEHGERELTAEAMGRRLSDLNWIKYKPRVADRRVPSWRNATWVAPDSIDEGNPDHNDQP